MDFFTYLFMQMDKILMPFYRFPENPLLGYYLGTFILCLICLIFGEFSIALAFRVNKKNIAHDNNEIAHYQDLSIKALKAGDKAAYKASNSIANDAFGKAFFMQIALSASSLWPVFIALGWMQYRFEGVKFTLPFSMPLLGNEVGYLATFILCYVFSRLLFGKIKKRLTYFKNIKNMVCPSNGVNKPGPV